MNNKTILILPGCDDKNRGDQALIWESVRIARDAGLKGRYYMLTDEESLTQSKKEKIYNAFPILPHPSSHYKKLHDNRRYSIIMKLLWGFAAIADFIRSAPLKYPAIRSIFRLFLSSKQRETLDIIKNADAAIVKGGGFLHNSKGLAETYKIYFFLYHINLALSYNVPVYVMPNSYGPFEGKVTRKMVEKTLKKCKMVYSRESVSQKVLKKQCNIDSLVSMDLGAYLLKDNSFEGFGYLIKRGIPIDKEKCVSLTVRPYRFPDSKNPDRAYKQYKESIVKLIKYLIKNNYFPVLIEHVYSKNYNECDYKCIEDIINRLDFDKVSRKYYSVIIDRNLNCRQIKEIYSHFYCIIGTRFHSVIFSMFEDVPAIAITYGGNKGQGIMSDLGMAEYAIPIDKVNASILISTFEKLCNQYKEIKELLNEKKMDSLEQRKKIEKRLKKDFG